MNERIQELAYEAEDYADSKVDEGGEFHIHYTQKFAELIVRECINQCEEVAVGADKVSKSKFVTDAGRMLHEGMWGGAKNCSGRIKQHFGVV